MCYSAQKFGFTLIELLLVVAIIAVLTGALIPNFVRYLDRQTVLQAQEQTKSDLRTIQNNALTGVGADPESANPPTHWGIRINNGGNKFATFTTNSTGDCGGATSTRTTEKLPGDVVSRSGSTICVYFAFEDGDATFWESGGSPSCAVDAMSGCVIELGYSTSVGTECVGIGVNDVGLIRGLDNQTCN